MTAFLYQRSSMDIAAAARRKRCSWIQPARPLKRLGTNRATSVRCATLRRGKGVDGQSVVRVVTNWSTSPAAISRR